jgi:hypothetical protein
MTKAICVSKRARRADFRAPLRFFQASLLGLIDDFHMKSLCLPYGFGFTLVGTRQVELERQRAFYVECDC